MKFSIIKRKWIDRLERWFIPVNLRFLVQTQGAIDAIFAFGLAAFFLLELARPGSFTSMEVLKRMSSSESRRYHAFYLWYAFMYLVQMTASLLLYMDVRNVKYNVDSRRRTIFLFLLYSPTPLVNLLLSAANILYFPWSPMGLFCVLHILYLTPYWLYARRYYLWLGDTEHVHYEAPLVSSAGCTSAAYHADQEAGQSEPPLVQLQLNERDLVIECKE